MERITLYPKPPKLAVESVIPRGFDPACERCNLRKTTKQVIQGESFFTGASPESQGTLLVVGEGPGRHENEEGRPFRGPGGAEVRPLIRKLWQGTIVLDNGERCYPGRGDKRIEVEDEHYDECRPFLAQTVADAKPDRIVCLGAQALYSVLGRHISPLNSRRGYAWLWNDGKPVPVFYVLHPTAGLRNRFLRKFFQEDFTWALTAKVPRPKHLDPDFFAAMVMTPADAAEACEELQRGEGFAFDAEWAGFMWDPDFRLMALAAAPVGRDSVWVWDEDALNDPARFEPLSELLRDAEVPKGGSNVKADLHALWWAKKVRIKGIAFDTRLMRKLLDPDATANLEDMAELVGMGGHKEEANASISEIEQRIAAWARGQVKGRASKQNGFEFAAAVDSAARLGFDMEKYSEEPRAVAYAFLEKELLHRYVARDSVTTARLASQYTYQLLQRPEAQRVWDRLVHPAIHAVEKMEEHGVPFDRQAGQLFRDLMQQGKDAAYTKVQHYADPGKPLNVASPQQLAKVLYDKLGLKPPFRTKSGAPSTDEEALSSLSAQSNHPLPALILEFRHYEKLVGYATDWFRCVRSDGRIHPSIHQDGARSGRMSCSDPNLQNIPRAADSVDGKMARDCFIAPPGYKLVQLDYSQLELRIAALMSRDQAMADLFKSGVDFHLGTAKMISQIAWGIPPDQVGKPHRTGAKAVNFALAYGKTDRTLGLELGIPTEQATKIRLAIFGKFQNFATWTKDAIGYARANGGCWTTWEGERARWRALWRIADETEEGSGAANKAKNGAINTPIQGTASDFLTASIAKLVAQEESGELGAEVILPVHDSVMLLAPEATWERSARLARDTMQSFPWATGFVPLSVDVEVGTKWGSLEGVELN